MQNPASDVAAMAAAGLAMSAQVLAVHGATEDQALVEKWTLKAERTYAYAKTMWEQLGAESTCSKSSAIGNCIGSSCTKVREDGKAVRGVRTPSVQSEHFSIVLLFHHFLELHTRWFYSAFFLLKMINEFIFLRNSVFVAAMQAVRELEAGRHVSVHCCCGFVPQDRQARLQGRCRLPL